MEKHRKSRRLVPIESICLSNYKIGSNIQINDLSDELELQKKMYVFSQVDCNETIDIHANNRKNATQMH